MRIGKREASATLVRSDIPGNALISLLIFDEGIWSIMDSILMAVKKENNSNTDKTPMANIYKTIFLSTNTFSR